MVRRNAPHLDIKRHPEMGKGESPITLAAEFSAIGDWVQAPGYRGVRKYTPKSEPNCRKWCKKPKTPQILTGGKRHFLRKPPPPESIEFEEVLAVRNAEIFSET